METEYARYARENEDLEVEDNGTNCLSCNVYLGEQGLIICAPCEAREDALEGALRS